MCEYSVAEYVCVEYVYSVWVYWVPRVGIRGVFPLGSVIQEWLEGDGRINTLNWNWPAPLLKGHSADFAH